MEDNADWVEDVRRWYFNGTRAAKPASNLPHRPDDTDAATLGYEAAHPALQAAHWATPPASGFGALY